jgi:hypothetical protein
MKNSTARNRFKLGLRCLKCGGARSDESDRYCRNCIKTGEADYKFIETYSNTTDWFWDLLGVKTRLHGDINV